MVRNGSQVEVFMTAVRSHFTSEHVEIQEGDHVTWHITNIERAYDATHGFSTVSMKAAVSSGLLHHMLSLLAP